MSLEMPETPSRPDSLYSSASIAARIHVQVVQQQEDHAGIERPAARPHGQPVERREAHRRGDTPAVAERTEARAVAQVCHYDSTGGSPSVDTAAAPTRCTRMRFRGTRTA